MIIVIIPEVNLVTQNIYDQITERLDPSQLTCAKCSHTGTTIHGYYNRKLKTAVGKIVLSIMRVKCSFCGATHAILLSSIVPYSWITLKDTVSIITAQSADQRYRIMEETPDIDESDVYRIIRNYKSHWKQRLLSFRIPIDDEVASRCISVFKRMFMQIPSTLCSSYSCSHIIQQDMGFIFS